MNLSQSIFKCHIRVLSCWCFICLAVNSFAQIGTTIPLERRVDWSTAGYYRNPDSVLPVPKIKLEVPPPSHDPNVNYENLNDKINEASKIDGLVEISLSEGNYRFNKPIMFTNQNSNLLLKGAGIEKTVISFSTNKNQGIYGFRVEGIPIKLKPKIQIINYNKSEKKIFLDRYLPENYENFYLDIRVENGSWLNSPNIKNNQLEDILGQIVKIREINLQENEIKIEDDISIIWEKALLESKKIYIEVFQPTENIFFKDFKIECDKSDNGLGSNFIFRYAANCLVQNVESYFPPQVHIEIDRSSSIVVRNCNIHHAQDYGNIPGAGYGVHIHSRSTNCLIENNSFYTLRHSMIVTRSANRNVFGYNYSTKQFSSPVKDLADLNVHGLYPFANLFEGNIVERIHADNYWGSNGPYNTFFRNLVDKKYFKIEEANYSNLILFDEEVSMKNSSFAFIKRINHDSVSDTSYYRTHQPIFMKDYIWPFVRSKSNTHLLPAKERLEKRE